jgi:cephalosporin hydroxylase
MAAPANWLRSLPRRARNLARRPQRICRRWFTARGDYHERWRMTLRDWLLHHQREIGFKQSRWMGLPAYKNPLDAWIYQEIFYEVRPTAIVEIGSANGGSTLYFAHLLDLLGDGIVVSVDVDRSRFAARHPRIEALTGSSSAPDIVAAVKAATAGRRTLVIHDGDHRKAQVLLDLEAYAPIVSTGSYLIVEDGIIDLFDPGDSIGTVEEGPLAAVEEFLAAHPEFVVDEGRERYLLTYNPRGFLRRLP